MNDLIVIGFIFVLLAATIGFIRGLDRLMEK